MARLLAKENWLLALLVFFPVALALESAGHAPSLAIFLSYLIAPAPMDLRFTTLEVVAVGISVWIMSLVAQDGESHWMEGVQLLAVYIILGMAFSWLPTSTN